ncbi:pectinesterase-like [Canna indica]|uniref:Pectinesterase n=1 Tax=Canna indica TaxID=4628 RepID=A0AAQ3KH75_9LILI|nr:pectinesterase-like [Canna indica]
MPAALLFLLIFSLPSPSLSHSGDIDHWCTSTPHPGPCRYYLGRNPHLSAPPKDKAQFYKLSLQLAFDLSLRAQSHLKRRGSACRHAPEKTAWNDCWKLYANTVLQLNRTLADSAGCGGSRTTAAFDSQTWLSAALTNLQTCLKGFNETGASSAIIAPVTRYNVSDIVSNCLAINRPEAVAAAAAAAATDASTTEVDDRRRVSSWMMLHARRRLLQLSPRGANLVVAKDGSGNFQTIGEALAAALSRGNAKFVIYVKAGVYNEYLQVDSSLNNLVMIGDGIGKSIITGSRSVANGYTTLSSATFSVYGDGFIASGITFRNTFGPGSQAVALMSASDRSAFYRCSVEGYQDTLFVYSQRQFFRECDIYGTIDFIFGNAAVVLQRCNIYGRLPRHGESDVITAQGRSDPNQNTGIVIQRSNIRPGPDLLPSRGTVKSYLGRPWMQYSRTVYMQNYIGSFINADGWLPFRGNFALNTLYYAEFRNTGPGSRMSQRVRWPGYHVIVRPSIMRPFTVGRFIAGQQWIPATGVPFDPSF